MRALFVLVINPGTRFVIGSWRAAGLQFSLSRIKPRFTDDFQTRKRGDAVQADLIFSESHSGGKATMLGSEFSDWLRFFDRSDRRSSVKTMRGFLHSSPGFGEGLVVARMTRIRFGPLVVAVLLSLWARAAASETAPAQTRIDLVGVPRGLADIGSAACDDARSFCRTAVLRALGEDEKLTRFLDNVRELARRASTPGSADGYAVAVPDPSSLKLPELLALGCCLSAGDCADEVTSSLPTDADADARIDASISAAAAAAEILALAASHPDAARAPAIGATMMLAADAVACSPPGDARRCDDSVVDAFRAAGRAGANEGALRAAEVLIARYAGGLVERRGGCEDGGDGGAGDPADAAVARALLKGLLATTLDGVAARRLKELQRVEEMRVAGGEHDAAYEVADALVNSAAKLLAFLAIVAAPLRLSSSLRDRAWRWSGCAAFARQFRREMEWLGVVRHRRVNGGRQARRFEGQKVTKKTARRVVKDR